MIHDSLGETEIMDNLRIGSYGWKHKAWQDSFYPEDLPEDWQLTYYANEYSSVLIPTHYLLGDECDIEQWQDDVPDAFRFYLQWPETEVDDDSVLKKLPLFGDQLAGVLIPRQRPLGLDIPVYYWQGSDIQKQVWQPNNAAQSGVAGIRLGKSDLKTQKNELKQFQENTTKGLKTVFLMDDNLDIQQLNEFKTLVELLGL